MAPRKGRGGKKPAKKAGSMNARKVIPMTKEQATIFFKRLAWRRRLQRRKEDKLGITDLVRRIKENEDQKIKSGGADFLQAKEKKRRLKKGKTKTLPAPHEVFALLRKQGRLNLPQSQIRIIEISVPTFIDIANLTQKNKIKSFDSLMKYFDYAIRISKDIREEKIFCDYLDYLKNCCLMHKDLVTQLIFRSGGKE